MAWRTFRPTSTAIREPSFLSNNNGNEFAKSLIGRPAYPMQEYDETKRPCKPKLEPRKRNYLRIWLIIFAPNHESTIQ
jgi:hypothetical protein